MDFSSHFPLSVFRFREPISSLPDGQPYGVLMECGSPAAAFSTTVIRGQRRACRGSRCCSIASTPPPGCPTRRLCVWELFLHRFALSSFCSRGKSMAPPKMLLPTLNWEGRFLVENSDDVMTPALLIYPDAIASNIGATLKVLHGNADRWRAHVKTAKLAFTMRMMADRGVTNFKCATTLELLVACQSGARDVLVAYPVV